MYGETIDVILTAEHKNYMRIKMRSVNAPELLSYELLYVELHHLIVQVELHLIVHHHATVRAASSDRPSSYR